MLVPLLGYALHKKDPFFLSQPFPWIILSPLVVSLRYGIFFGAVASVLTIAFIGLAYTMKWPDPFIFPMELVTAMLFVTLLCGEFQAYWLKKLAAGRKDKRDIKEKMTSFARSYHVLQASCALLEKQNLGKSVSLRNKLSNIEKKLLSLSEVSDKPLHGVAGCLLDIFAEHGGFYRASIHFLAANGVLEPSPAATLGKELAELCVNNFLIQDAIKTGKVSSINTGDSLYQEILVAIPLTDVSGRIWGVVLVFEMSMFHLTREVLELLALIGGHAGDLISQRCAIAQGDHSEARRSHSDLSLIRAIEDRKKYDCEVSILFTIAYDGDTADKCNTLRCSDLCSVSNSWLFHDKFGKEVVVNILHLNSYDGASDYLRREYGLADLSIEQEIPLERGGSCRLILGKEVAFYYWNLENDCQADEVLMKVQSLFQVINFGDYEKRILM
jgi:hypothetical protein